MPNTGLAYTAAAGACSTRMRVQSASSSSAISIGSVVQMPWPISECASSTVTRSSVPMRRKALGASAAAPGACAKARRRPPGTTKATTRPPPSRAPALRKLRRETVLSLFTGSLRRTGAPRGRRARIRRGRLEVDDRGRACRWRWRGGAPRCCRALAGCRARRSRDISFAGAVANIT